LISSHRTPCYCSIKQIRFQNQHINKFASQIEGKLNLSTSMAWLGSIAVDKPGKWHSWQAILRPLETGQSESFSSLLFFPPNPLLGSLRE